MQLTRSIFEMTGAPPAAFTPGRMLEGTTARRRASWRNVPVTNARVTLTSTTAESVAKSVWLSLPSSRLKGVAQFNLEMTGADEARAALSNIPFEVVATEAGEMTFNSERQQTPWHFLLKLDPATNQMILSFTLTYAGLSVDQALEGARFYQSLARGGEFRLSGKHPITGADLTVTRGNLPSGAYEGPGPFINLLEHLAFIEAKAGVSFTIPAQAISAEDANNIAAIANILKTGHAKYTAKPWVSVSNVEQAKAALESVAGGEPIPTALHFEEQVIVIFGTHVSLGPVTFFCDRTYITNKDLETLRKDIENSTPESTINVRLSPYEECPIEARYINWLPENEAAEIRRLPMYQRSDPGLEEEDWTLQPMEADKAVALLQSWYDEDAEEQRKTWELLKVALDEDRLSDRKLFS
jgi:hypothetical protein